jgi:dihydroxy-acid dehydratase
MAKPDEPADTGMRKGLTSYGDAGFSLFLRKAFIKGAGYTDTALDRPVIGITDTGSGYNPCHGNMPQLVEAVQRGIMLAGGLPVKFPTISIGESFAHPTSMFLRNLMSIDTEEMIRAQPMDAVVLIGGCDKTVPAQLMGAASAGIRRCSWSRARCSPVRIAARPWVRAPTAGVTGAAIAPTRSMRRKSRRSTTSSWPAWALAR